jgi:flagellar motor switch/type III secretory pathway protein FliN
MTPVMEETTVVDAMAPSINHEAWNEAQWLPCELQVDLVVPNFTIGDLLRLEPETIIDSQWKQNADIPLRVNGMVLGYAEFEVIGTKSAVRLTELL